MGPHHGDEVEPEGPEQDQVREQVGGGGDAPSQELGDNPRFELVRVRARRDPLGIPC